MVSIFIHRRDFRLDDNTTLNKLLALTKGKVQPIFIFTPTQIDESKNKYRSNVLVEFMCESLLELDEEYQEYSDGGVKLEFFYGEPVDVLANIKQVTTIKSIGWNRDYSPYSKERDQAMVDWADQNKIEIYQEEDLLLVPIEADVNKSGAGTPYQKYSFFNKKIKPEIRGIVSPCHGKFMSNNINWSQCKFNLPRDSVKEFYHSVPARNVSPGRRAGLNQLNRLIKIKEYADTRDTLSLPTSNLSAYLNLGCISIREAYQQGLQVFGKDSSWIDELIWRDFYYNILYYFPHVVGGNFNDLYDKFKWDSDQNNYKKWCNGNTGFPIIDAAMRQLNQTGFMHNRGRMLVASFLTKDLGLDWRLGERYFATHLQDYNLAANNGGWQWSSGTGTDAQPYFRIFSPWAQAKTHDPDCKYIKRWIPELADVPNKVVFKWDTECTNTEYQWCKYPCPIVNHTECAKYSQQQHKGLRNK